MKPILFNTEMVRAILDGRKTTTRRVIKPHYHDDEYGFNVWHNEETKRYVVEKYDEDERDFEQTRYINSPCEIGDVLYVRETFCSAYDGEAYFYFADKCTSREQKKLLDYDDVRWHPSLHMPKEAARIFLKVTDVRVERLQDITEEQAKSEGTLPTTTPYIAGKGRTYVQGFGTVWNSTVKKSDIDRYGWNANPFVWVIEFERCEKLLGGDGS